MTTRADALTYQQDLKALNRKATGLILARWRKVDLGDISKSWLSMVHDVSSILVAAQIVAAEAADPYLDKTLGSRQGDASVDPEAFAGLTPDGRPVESLMYRPAIEAKQGVEQGKPGQVALREAEQKLSLYSLTTIADAGRLATAAGIGGRRGAFGYYRMLVTPSCSRCAILAGKWFGWNHGFQRHPRCDCVHIPVHEADDSLAFDARKAVEAGQVTGLSQAKTKAILDLGANPAAVVNADRGMYLAGGRSFTREGVSRRGVAGARIMQRDYERLLGIDVGSKTFDNFAFSKDLADRYAKLLRQGRLYTRLTKTGKAQSYTYRYARTPRPTVEQILKDAKDRDDAIRLLTNYGYIL